MGKESRDEEKSPEAAPQRGGGKKSERQAGAVLIKQGAPAMSWGPCAFRQPSLAVPKVRDRYMSMSHSVLGQIQGSFVRIQVAHKGGSLEVAIGRAP